jgi:hypothetical protein
VWPTERRDLYQRYADAPVAELLVPTLPAFTASKTATWADRHAARDLWDLWALSRLGAIDATAATLYQRYGPTTKAPGPYLFRGAPSDADWQAQLAGQTRLNVSSTKRSKRYAQLGNRPCEHTNSRSGLKWGGRSSNPRPRDYE